MVFPVPSYSQYLDVPQPKWRGRSCGVVALKMVLDYWRKKTVEDSPTITTLIRLGTSGNAYIKGVGWKHLGLVKMARRYRFRSKNYDWANEHHAVASKKLLLILRKQPIIASIYRNTKTKKGGHLVVLTGIRESDGKICMIDPAEKTRKREIRSVSLNAFTRSWKQRVIIVSPIRLPKKGRVGKV